MDFQDLLHPVAPDAFFSQHWERAPLVIARESPRYFERVFSTAALEQAVFYSRPKPPAIKVVKEQEELLPDRYITPEGDIHLNQLYKAYAEGHSVVLNGLHKFWGPAADLVRATQSALSHKVQANAYLTPAGATALSPHFDTHDVFALQIEGSKRWWIHAAPQESPLLGSFQPVIPKDRCGPLILEVVLHAGDVLYMPRGFVHHAAATEEHSLHVTLGVYPVQALDLLTNALSALAMRDVRLRKALSPGFLERDDSAAELQEVLASLLREAADTARAGDALEVVRDRLIRETPARPDGQLAELTKLTAIDLDTSAVKRDGLSCRTASDLFNVYIQFPGNTVKGTPEYGPAMRFVEVAEGPFTPRDLPGLSDERRINLVKRLVRGGLLRTVANGRANGA